MAVKKRLYCSATAFHTYPRSSREAEAERVEAGLYVCKLE